MSAAPHSFHKPLPRVRPRAPVLCSALFWAKWRCWDPEGLARAALHHHAPASPRLQPPRPGTLPRLLAPAGAAAPLVLRGGGGCFTPGIQELLRGSCRVMRNLKNWEPGPRPGGFFLAECPLRPRPVWWRPDPGCWELGGRGSCAQLERGGSCAVAPSRLIPWPWRRKLNSLRGNISGEEERPVHGWGKWELGGGCPGRPSGVHTVHGQIAQVAGGSRAQSWARACLGAWGQAVWGRLPVPGREQLRAPGPGASLRSPNYF